MGKFYNGVNGPFTGKVGTAVGTQWKGIPVLRSRPQKRKKPFSEAELRQQAKFKLMSRFLKMATPMLDITFRQAAVQMSGFNKAFSYNVKNAITGEYPDLKIDFPMVRVGQGDLPNADIAANGGGSISFELMGAKDTVLSEIYDADGTAIVVHEKADDYRTDPTGNAGSRLACGVFEAH